MTKKAHKKYLENLNPNPEWCTLLPVSQCFVVEKTQQNCKGCWFHEKEVKKRKELKNEK